jgi:ABC-type multidrug transport system fused ATPase/permease subunit
MESEVTLQKQLKRLWLHLSPRRRKQFGVVLLLMLVTSLTEVVSIGAIFPFLAALTAPETIFEHPTAQPIIQWLGYTRPSQIIFPLALGFAVAAIVAGSMRLLLLYTTTRLTYSTGADLSAKMYKLSLYQPYTVHVGRNSSEIINGITAKSNAITFNVLLSLLNITSSAVMLISILAALLYVNPQIAMVSIMGLGVMYSLIIAVFNKRLKTNSIHISSSSTQVIKTLQEGLGAIRDILIDGTQSTYCQNFQRADTLLKRSLGNNQFIGGAPRFFMEALGMSFIAGLALVLLSKPDGVTYVIPVLGALTLGMQRMLPAAQQAYAAFTNIKGQQKSLSDALNLLDQPLPQYLLFPELKSIAFECSIELNNVDFRYGLEEPLVLHKINFSITKGSRTGIIGTTGSGKSTLLDLIMGLLNPTNGDLIVDGEVVNVEKCRAWQAHIAHVPQSIYLSDSSIAENIAFGLPKEKIVIEQVKESARQAQIAELIEGLPDQYETRVGERGARLSGGQRQRLGIARALYKNADVIIFDEATSALDNETEKAVMQAIDTLGNDLTIIIIAHRLSTLQRCDNVIELAQGRVIRKGDYKEMIEQPTHISGAKHVN